MNEKPTYELDKILNDVSPEQFEQYNNSINEDSNINVSEYFNSYIGMNNLELSDVIKKSDISSNYAYGILNGNRKNPSRDRVIALCIACEMDLVHTNRALKIAGHNQLYSKVSRDAAIIIMINKEEYNMRIINEFLYGHNLDILKTSNN
uniref:hypothetical protein n=1 Tax=[Lactobacillus] rogosae TaxID=706562 RepID=UPI00402ADD9E